MRAIRTHTLVAVLCVLGLFAAPSASAADVFRVDFKGGVALAVWQTCPQWEVGAVCEETVVIASDSMTSEKYPGGRERDRGPRVILQRFVFEIVDLGEDGISSRPIRESFGGTDEADVTIDRRSRWATASAAAIPMNTTEYHGDESITYEETVSLDVEWTGQGELQGIDERSHYNDRDQLFISSTKGWERPAVATGTIDGDPITGTLDETATTLINVRQGELRLYKRQP
jgi:hypothetical protein